MTWPFFSQHSMYHFHELWVSCSITTSCISSIESKQYPLEVNLNFGNRKNSAGEISPACGTTVVVEKLAVYRPQFWLLFCTAACSLRKGKHVTGLHSCYMHVKL